MIGRHPPKKKKKGSVAIRIIIEEQTLDKYLGAYVRVYLVSLFSQMLMLMFEIDVYSENTWRITSQNSVISLPIFLLVCAEMSRLKD